MDRLKKAALLTSLAVGLEKKGSWCGETHLQKATFFLQELQRVPIGYRFILYKHGPFSFELRDDLTAMRAYGLIELKAQWPYGPSIVPTDQSLELMTDYSKTLRRYQKQVTFVAEQLGKQNVFDLEKLATAFYIWKEKASVSESQRARQLHSLKPHITLDDSLKAVQAVDGIVRRAKTASA